MKGNSIKPGELRLRNWVEHIEKGYCQVLRIAVDELLDSVNSIERSLSQYEPIPLTKEVLEKCGFTNTGWATLGRDFGDYTFNVVWNYSEFGDYTLIVELRKFMIVEKHEAALHDLQNLVFAFGNEFEITL